MTGHTGATGRAHVITAKAGLAGLKRFRDQFRA
jgi:hypothetical protein